MVAQSTRLLLPSRSSDSTSRRIHRLMLYWLEYCARHPEAISQRLRELDDEWDIERALQADIAALGLFGMLLAFLRGRRYLLLSLVAFGFLLQHAQTRRCPPLALLRRLGLRMREEIAVERQALKILRGDFDDARRDVGAERAAAIAGR